jgi:hypothetical protein
MLDIASDEIPEKIFEYLKMQVFFLFVADFGFFWVPGSMLLCYFASLLFCFSAFLLLCFAAFSASP